MVPLEAVRISKYSHLWASVFNGDLVILIGIFAFEEGFQCLFDGNKELARLRCMLI